MQHRQTVYESGQDQPAGENSGFSRVPQREEWAIVLRRELPGARARPAREIAAGLWARVVGVADELARKWIYRERRAVIVDHAHVRMDAVEADEGVGTVADAGVVVPGDPHVVVEPGETASATIQTLGDARRGHASSPGARGRCRHAGRATARLA
jgi:hypothetical protein